MNLRLSAARTLCALCCRSIYRLVIMWKWRRVLEKKILAFHSTFVSISTSYRQLRVVVETTRRSASSHSLKNAMGAESENNLRHCLFPLNVAEVQVCDPVSFRYGRSHDALVAAKGAFSKEDI